MWPYLTFMVLGIMFFLLFLTRINLLIRIHELENPGVSHRDMKEDCPSVVYLVLASLTFFPSLNAFLYYLQKSI